VPVHDDSICVLLRKNSPAHTSAIRPSPGPFKKCDFGRASAVGYAPHQPAHPQLDPSSRPLPAWRGEDGARATADEKSAAHPCLPPWTVSLSKCRSSLPKSPPPLPSRTDMPSTFSSSSVLRISTGWRRRATLTDAGIKRLQTLQRLANC
jgi:hypothetical protein